LQAEKEAGLLTLLKQHQGIEKRSALTELAKLQQDSDVLRQYLEEQQKITDREVRQF
jgi:hypothetical protein